MDELVIGNILFYGCGWLLLSVLIVFLFSIMKPGGWYVQCEICGREQEFKTHLPIGWSMVMEPDPKDGDWGLVCDRCANNGQLDDLLQYLNEGDR